MLKPTESGDNHRLLLDAARGVVVVVRALYGGVAAAQVERVRLRVEGRVFVRVRRDARPRAGVLLRFQRNTYSSTLFFFAKLICHDDGCY